MKAFIFRTEEITTYSAQQTSISNVAEKNLFKEKDIRGTSVAPVTPIRMKPSTMNWLMNRGFAAVAPRVLRPLTLRPPTPRPLEQQSLGPQTLGPQPQSLESGPLVTRPLVSLPQEPRPLKLLLPNVPLNMDMNSAAMPNFPIYNYMPALIDENHFRRRRQIHTNVTNSTWIPSESLLSTVNNPQPGMEITNITYMDPTGGSMIVTRRGQDGELDVRMVYSREFIIAASASPLALLPPANFRNMVLNMMEIIPKFPTSYYNNISRDPI
ncbi:unnamed protein product [Brugia pahangi]|uniref:Uncharacterized protein n=1 Tax=Brugia pahangi TaxID=6280 RepID=A0A3P7QWB1_BRUPA|nr:unnamed protein product [Brugia pahangi]